MNTSLISTIDAKKLKFAKERTDRDTYLKIVNQNPPAKWIVENECILDEKGKPAKYIPIGIIENTLTQLFQDWNVEVKDVQIIFNSVAVTVRLHYRDPLTGEMRYQDGVGAKNMQCDKGTSLSISTIKANAVMAGLPSAKSYAIKDAVEHIGKLFGRDIGRKNDLDFVPRYSNEDGTPRNQEDARVRKFISDATTPEQLSDIENKLISADVFTKEYGLLISEKLKKIDATRQFTA